jgi:hypothetical protein
MSGRGGIYEGPGGQKLYGDGREVESSGQLRELEKLVDKAKDPLLWYVDNISCRKCLKCDTDFVVLRPSTQEHCTACVVALERERCAEVADKAGARYIASDIRRRGKAKS